MTAVVNRWFYFGLSLVMTTVVLYGFGRNIETRLLDAAPPRPLILWVHTVLFCGWMAFFIAQSALVRTRNVKMHRTLGWGGAALSGAMTVVGVITAVVMAHFEVQYLNAGPLRVAALLISLWNIATFTALFWLAVYWRKKPELHRRLMLVATGMLMAPAFARFPQPFISHYFLFWVDAAILLGAARDLIVARRIHVVYYCTFPILIAGQLFVANTVLSQPAWWMRIAGFLVR